MLNKVYKAKMLKNTGNPLAIDFIVRNLTQLNANNENHGVQKPNF